MLIGVGWVNRPDWFICLSVWWSSDLFSLIEYSVIYFASMVVLFLLARGFEINMEYYRGIVPLWWFIFASIFVIFTAGWLSYINLCLRMTKWSSSIRLVFVELFCFHFVAQGGYKFLHPCLKTNSVQVIDNKHCYISHLIR